MKRTMNGLLALLLVSCLGLSGFAQGNEWERLIDEARGLRSIKRHDRAAVAAKKALEVAEQAFGPDHPNVATSLTSLASVHVSQGEYEQAEPLYKRFLAIGEKAGPFAVATNLNKLASAYVSQGQYAQAEPLSKRCAGDDGKGPSDRIIPHVATIPEPGPRDSGTFP